METATAPSAPTTAPAPAPTAPTQDVSPSPQPMDLAPEPSAPAPNLQTQTNWSSYVPPQPHRERQAGPTQATEPAPPQDPIPQQPEVNQAQPSVPQNAPEPNLQRDVQETLDRTAPVVQEQNERAAHDKYMAELREAQMVAKLKEQRSAPALDNTLTPERHRLDDIASMPIDPRGDHDRPSTPQNKLDDQFPSETAARMRELMEKIARKIDESPDDTPSPQATTPLYETPAGTNLQPGLSSRDHAAPQAPQQQPSSAPPRVVADPPAAPHQTEEPKSRQMDVAGLEHPKPDHVDKFDHPVEAEKSTSPPDSAAGKDLYDWVKAHPGESVEDVKPEIAAWTMAHALAEEKKKVDQAAREAAQDAYRQAAGQHEQPERSAAERAYFDDLREAQRRASSTPRPYPKTDVDPDRRPRTVPETFAPQSFTPENKAYVPPQNTATRKVLRTVGLGKMADALDKADVDLYDPGHEKREDRYPDRDERTRYALREATRKRERTTIAREEHTRKRATTMTTPVQGVEAHYTAKQNAKQADMWATRKAHELPTGYDRTESKATAKEAWQDIKPKTLNPLRVLFPDAAWRYDAKKKLRLEMQAAAMANVHQLHQAAPMPAPQADAEAVRKMHAMGQTQQKTQQAAQQRGHLSGFIGFIDPRTYDPKITTHRMGENSKDCMDKECPCCSKKANKFKGGSGKIGLPEVASTEEHNKLGYWVYAPDDRHSMYAGSVFGRLLERVKASKKGKGR